MLLSTFDVGEPLKVLLKGYCFLGKVKAVKDKTYVVMLEDEDKTEVEVLKTQCYNASYYWYKYEYK